MYTFINPHFCASIAQLGTWQGRKPNIISPCNVPHLIFITTMYNRSLIRKAFREKKLFWHQAHNFNVHHIKVAKTHPETHYSCPPTCHLNIL